MKNINIYFPLKLKNKFITDKGYTLVELLIGMSVILILATSAIISYQYALNASKRRICKTNLKVLSIAIESYMLEKEVFPAVLGDLKLEHFQKGFAYAMQESGWFTKFSNFFVKLNTPSVAYAQFLTLENLKEYGVMKDFFEDPADENGGVSYGLNGNLAGKTWEEIDNDETLIGDSETYVFTGVEELAHRHKFSFLSSGTALVITKGKETSTGYGIYACTEEDLNVVECEDD